MSELQLALIGLAFVLLLALLVYNKWQERRALRQLRESLNAGVADALLDTEPAPLPRGLPASQANAPRVQEPTLRTINEFTPPPGRRVEPRLASSPSAQLAQEGGPVGAAPEAAAIAEDAPAAAAAATGGWVEDPLLDCVLELRCTHAVDGVAVFDAAAPLAHWDAPLPVFLVAWDARQQQWVQPDRFGFYSDLLVAVQLANRRRALDDILASRFVSAVQQVAMALDADFDPPEVKRVVEQAAELDRLCARFDVQIGMTLESPGGPWDSAQLAKATSHAGLVADGEHRWVGVDAAGRVLFSVSSASLLTDRLAFELDVPLAAADAQPLQAMFAAATGMAASLGASLVDDNKRPINAGSLAAIGEQLQVLYGEMRNAGIEPGGMRAQRLYG
jgi:FtsZ-interacting cell division protein ZipA